MFHVNTDRQDVCCGGDGGTGRKHGEVDGRTVTLCGTVGAVGNEDRGINTETCTLGSSDMRNKEIRNAGIVADIEGNRIPLAYVRQGGDGGDGVCRGTHTDNDGRVGVAVVVVHEIQHHFRPLSVGKVKIHCVQPYALLLRSCKIPLESAVGIALLVTVVVVRVFTVTYNVCRLIGADIQIIVAVVIEMRSRITLVEINTGIDALAWLRAGYNKFESSAAGGICC